MNKIIKMDRDDCDEDGKLIVGTPTLPIYSSQNTSTTYKVFIDEEIKSPSYYRNLTYTLDNASPNDDIIFHINSPGGNVYAGLQLYNGILNTEANTVAILEGMCVSAATFFPMACDSVMVMNGSFMMLHAASFGAIGDMKSIMDDVTFRNKELEKMIHRVYKDFLTEEEIEDMIQNKREVWMSDEEVSRRLRARACAKNEEMEEEYEEDIIVEEKPQKKRVTKKKVDKEE